MGGGLIQLVAYGSQDMYLTGNPQITFFKSVYRRHTNFSIESISQTLTGTADFGGDLKAILSRTGDLIHKMYLEITLPQIQLSEGLVATYAVAFRWLNWIGHILLKEVKISIGGQEIDKQSGEWLHIWNELTQKGEKAEAYAEMVGNVPKLTQIYSSNTSGTNCNVDAYTLYIPLQFWFNRNAGLSLPIIALQYHDIEISIELETLDKCMWGHMIQHTADVTTVTNYNVAQGSNIFSSSSGFSTSTTPSLSSVKLYVDYIFLDTAERQRFSQVAHEYLIEKVQTKINRDIASSSTSTIISLNALSHPVKEIVWVIQPKKFKEKVFTQTRGGNQNFNFTDQYNYTGFTGTPENYWGPGLKGGRSGQNVFYGVPSVKVKGQFNEDTVNTNNFLGGVESTSIVFSHASANTNKEATGFTDILNYTPLSGVNTVDNRYLEHLMGPSLAVPSSSSDNNVGLWTGTNNDIKLLNGGKNPTTTAKLTLNGNDRFSARNGFYFNVVQPYNHHTSVPAPGINIYSFALRPEEHQPSGTCNFSRIDDSNLEISTLTTEIGSFTSNIRVYALSYNILRIMSGMGGLAYSS
jgi:hypothetical protein